MSERIVVTGLGVVSAAGVGVPAFWSSVLSGRPACTLNHRFLLDGIASTAGLIPDFETETEFRWEGKVHPMERDRLCRIAETAILEALDDAGLDAAACRETALYMSSAIGPMSTMEKAMADRVGASASAAWRAFSLGRLPAYLARSTGLGGAYAMVPTGCTGGCDALGYAMAALRDGIAQRAVVGAFEAPVTPLVVASFARLGATSSRDCAPEQASCPFDVARDGFVLGEGGGALVIETETAARARGAVPLAIVSGYGSVSSAFHMTDIHVSGTPIARSIEAALRDAGLAPDAIGHVNLHGSSTPQNDVAESNAMRAVFGERTSAIPVTSLKSQVGHALAGANAIELVSVVLSLRDGLIPPTANLNQLDPECRLDVVAGGARAGDLAHVAKTASGFSGIHSALILSRCEA